MTYSGGGGWVAVGRGRDGAKSGKTLHTADGCLNDCADEFNLVCCTQRPAFT